MSSSHLYQWCWYTLTLSLTLLGLHHRSVKMFDVEETKSHSGVTRQTSCWKLCHILVKLQNSNNCALWSVLTDDWGCWPCYLLMCSCDVWTRSHMLGCICRSGPDFCIICFAVLGTVWLSSGVCKFSKCGIHVSVLCVNRVLWNTSHTEDSQILGAAVQNEATWAMLYLRCVQFCHSDTVEFAEV
jgi:hypothetical protein